MVKQKIILTTFPLIILSLSVFVSAQSGDPAGGPVQYGECGDNICNLGENTPSYPYYCPQDCADDSIYYCEDHQTISNCICKKGKKTTRQYDIPYYFCEVQENECETIGLRQEGKYCSTDKTLEEQKEIESSCENNFECSSNLCISDKCVSRSLWAKFIRWLSRLFG
jgi:hypothetical protein